MLAFDSAGGILNTAQLDAPPPPPQSDDQPQIPLYYLFPDDMITYVPFECSLLVAPAVPDVMD